MQVDGEESHVEEEEPPKPERKKAGRKSSQNGAAKTQTQAQETDEEGGPMPVHKLGSMSQYKNIKDWEALIEKIVTVEKSEDGSIEVFFTMSVLPVFQLSSGFSFNENF